MSAYSQPHMALFVTATAMPPSMESRDSWQLIAQGAEAVCYPSADQTGTDPQIKAARPIMALAFSHRVHPHRMLCSVCTRRHSSVSPPSSRSAS